VLDTSKVEIILLKKMTVENFLCNRKYPSFISISEQSYTIEVS